MASSRWRQCVEFEIAQSIARCTEAEVSENENEEENKKETRDAKTSNQQ